MATADVLSGTNFHNAPAPHLDDPAQFATELTDRLQAAAAKNPHQYVEALDKYLKSPDTRKKMQEEAEKGLKAIRIIQDAFERVTGLLGSVDAQCFTGQDGNTIQKFAPEWLGYKNTFTQNLLKTEGLATAASGSIDLFVEGVLPLLEDKTILLKDKEAGLDAIAENVKDMESNVCTIDALILSYADLSSKITVFRATFIEVMDKVGSKLTEDIKRIKEDIAEIKVNIEKHKSSGKKFGIAAGAGAAAGVAIGVAACFAATGVLAPLALVFVGAAILFGVSAADEYFNKAKKLEKDLRTKEQELTELTQKQNAYNKLRPAMDAAAADMANISEQLNALGGVFKTIRNDILNAKLHLQNAAKAGQPPFLKTLEIKLAAQSYANLQVIMEAFATGWSDATKPASDS